MSGSRGDDNYPGHASGVMNPILQQFAQSFTTPQGQAWAQQAAALVQRHFTMRAVAEQNNDIGEQFLQNLSDFKTGLVNAVSKDPTFVHTALQLVPGTLKAMAAEHPSTAGMDDQVSTISQHIQGELAHAAVQSFAEKDESAARLALQSPAISALIPDNQKQALEQYIGSQAYYRMQDAVAAEQQSNRNAALSSYTKATGYLNSLVDPNSTDPQFPPEFGAQLMRDPGLGDTTRAAIHSGYTNLVRNGDVQNSDPNVVAGLVNRLANGGRVNQPEIFGALGSQLTLKDAQFFNEKIGPQNETSTADMKALDDHINDARDRLTSGNGAAGDAAFGRYMNWLMPALRNGEGAIGQKLDPDHANSIVANDPVQDFAPKPSDLVPPQNPVAPIHTFFGPADNG